mmetsp:Transcript_11462/g.16210  ORF Transcript_11462/g.16210 Transcript_11462/m.16210 type:complete len:97 (-) Transcript_11462:23-313(-)
MLFKSTADESLVTPPTYREDEIKFVKDPNLSNPSKHVFSQAIITAVPIYDNDPYTMQLLNTGDIIQITHSELYNNNPQAPTKSQNEGASHFPWIKN